MENRKISFVIYAPSYDEKSGGCIALHKLCHVINNLGHSAYIFPEIIPGGAVRDWLKVNGEASFDEIVSGNFRVNKTFNSPILSGAALNSIIAAEDVIVIYPEVTFGNPLGARRVVRWLLHDLGFHTGKIYLERGDMLIRYNALRGELSIPGCKVSAGVMRVAHIPFEKYNLQGVAAQRAGVAFCVRKGKEKAFIHSTEGAVLIDSLSHDEISSLFKRVSRFYSYDTATLYSRLAVLCGCESIIVPDPGVEDEEWCPDPALRHGLQYGDLGQGLPSPETIREVEIRLRSLDSEANIQVEKFMEEAVGYFYP